MPRSAIFSVQADMNLERTRVKLPAMRTVQAISEHGSHVIQGPNA